MWFKRMQRPYSRAENSAVSNVIINNNNDDDDDVDFVFSFQQPIQIVPL